MTEGKESDGGNSIENSSTAITTPISSGQLFGPFSNPIHWLSFKLCDNTCVNNNNPSNELFSKIDIARHSDEQNLKIVYKNSNYYFKSLINIKHEKTDESPKLKAWFSKKLAVRLPTPSSSYVNGILRYFCPLCNEVSMHSNPIVSHMLCTCPKRIQIDSIPEPSNENTSPSTVSNVQKPSVSKEGEQTPKVQVSKKRGFDIASLVRDEWIDSSSNKYSKNGFESEKSTETLNSSSAFHRPKSPPPIRKPSHSSTNTSIGISSGSIISSAFKKVDRKISAVSNPYDFSNIYQRVAANSMMPSTTHSINHSMLPQMSISTPMPTPLPTPLSSSSAKSLMSNTLLPFLPPSLAALTFPTTNWCAKCNASFRMTSDLVYHMRSHHKRPLTDDPIKKKREEKLRCNICNETFRERHHLTRHMTSHQ